MVNLFVSLAIMYVLTLFLLLVSMINSFLHIALVLNCNENNYKSNYSDLNKSIQITNNMFIFHAIALFILIITIGLKMYRRQYILMDEVVVQ